MIDTQAINGLLTKLEHSEDPCWETVYRSTLESWIAALMEEIYQHPYAKDKMRLVALEYRARLILQRWKSLHVN